jgi:hypothetical protein
LQVLTGPHGGGLLNMAFMRQPGTYGVADWASPDRVGEFTAMGPGDPVPAVRAACSRRDSSTSCGTQRQWVCLYAAAALRLC